MYEINFIDHLLESLSEGARAAVIVPQSTFTGKTKCEQNLKTKILKNHTLEGVITLNKNTFYGVGVNPCVGIFTAGVPHRKGKEAKFINFENDGFVVSKYIGLIDDGSAKDKKKHLLDVWNNRIEAAIKFCVKATVEDTDEWLHSFYYFNDEIPSDADFEKTIADYLSFEMSMILQGRGYLFGLGDKPAKDELESSSNTDGDADHV
nr:N-6 DNA methylase [Canibacter zhuwentaonis]